MDDNILENPPKRTLSHDLDVNERGISKDDLAVEILDLEASVQKHGDNALSRMIEDNSLSILEDNVRSKRQAAPAIKMVGLRVEEAAKEPKIVDGVIPSVLRETKFVLRLFGEGFTNDTVIAFTHSAEEYGSVCNHLVKGEYKVGYGLVLSFLLFLKPMLVKLSMLFRCALRVL